MGRLRCAPAGRQRNQSRNDLRRDERRVRGQRRPRFMAGGPGGADGGYRPDR